MIIFRLLSNGAKKMRFLTWFTMSVRTPQSVLIIASSLPLRMETPFFVSTCFDACLEPALTNDCFSYQSDVGFKSHPCEGGYGYHFSRRIPLRIQPFVQEGWPFSPL
jgi:hypothetical protein